MKKLLCIVPWPCLLLLLAATAPAADKPADKVTLKLTLAAGQTWTFDQQYDGSADTKTTLNGQTRTFTDKTHQHRAGKVELLAVADNRPSAMRITFADDCESTFQATGQSPQKVPFPYAGKTVTLTRQPDGTVKDDFPGQADPGAEQELHADIDPDTSIYPREPKSVGDEWPGDPAAVAKMFQTTGPRDQSAMVVKLIKVDALAGRQTAELQVTVSAFKEQQGMSTKLDAKGTIQIDLTTGHPVRVDMKGSTNANGTQTAPGPDGQPLTYHIDSAGTNATVVVSDLAGTLPAGPIATTNPLSTMPAASGVPTTNPASLAGRWTDGTLTLDLAESAGKYSGSIIMGKKYPAAAALRANTLEGTFEADGYNFPFTATFDGATLTLTSGGATYVLKK